ncbi:unnamed protein product [Amaranthus hypochondriacus]
MEDVFIPEEYVIKRRMERRAAAGLEGGKIWISSRRSQNEGIQAGNNQPKTCTNTSILWLDHRADSFLHSCCF